ncbi:MAG: LysR family transcriptional regulator [Actinobacteria bacterium]|nr:LysR family transcriptional regulator [Actinomycetota bacterium]
METDTLRWFQQVADGVTVTEVSDLEGVTQSGVSRALARLDQEAGTPLLRRSGRVLRMTRAGAAFKRHVDALLHELDDGLAAIGQVIDPERGTVNVAFQLSLGTWLVPDLISSFRAQHPQVSFELSQLRDELSQPVLGGEADLEISTVHPSEPNVQWHRLLTEPVRLAVSSSHRLADRRSVSLSEIDGEALVTLRPTYLLRQLGDELCQRAGIQVRIAFESQDLPTITGFVAAGLGIAIMPAPRSGTGPATLHYLRIEDPGASREIGIAWSTERRLLPAAALFRRHVLDRAEAKQLPAPLD